MNLSVVQGETDMSSDASIPAMLAISGYSIISTTVLETSLQANAREQSWKETSGRNSQLRQAVVASIRASFAAGEASRGLSLNQSHPILE
jgi:hypothetical protein